MIDQQCFAQTPATSTIHFRLRTTTALLCVPLSPLDRATDGYVQHWADYMMMRSGSSPFRTESFAKAAAQNRIQSDGKIKKKKKQADGTVGGWMARRLPPHMAKCDGITSSDTISNKEVEQGKKKD